MKLWVWIWLGLAVVGGLYFAALTYARRSSQDRVLSVMDAASSAILAAAGALPIAFVLSYMVDWAFGDPPHLLNWAIDIVEATQSFFSNAP